MFDKVLWKDSEQKDAWENAGKPMVNAVLEGYTGCVMCYGQTGAGKSFTLANEAKGQEGIMIAAFHHIFEVASASRDVKYEVGISCKRSRELSSSTFMRTAARGNTKSPLRIASHGLVVRSACSSLLSSLRLSDQQIYLDTITDLLNPTGNVEIREDPKSGVYVDGAKVRKRSAHE